MSDRVVRYLIGRIRNDVRTLRHTQRTRGQYKLLDHLRDALGELEVEVLKLKTEVATKETSKCEEVEKDQVAALE